MIVIIRLIMVMAKSIQLMRVIKMMRTKVTAIIKLTKIVIGIIQIM